MAGTFAVGKNLAANINTFTTSCKREAAPIKRRFPLARCGECINVDRKFFPAADVPAIVKWHCPEYNNAEE